MAKDIWPGRCHYRIHDTLRMATVCIDVSEPRSADGRKREALTPPALLGRIASNMSTAQLRQPADIDRQQQRMQQLNRRDASEIGVGDESHIAGDRQPTQCAHRTHAECGKHQAGGGKAYSVDNRQVAHPIFLLAELSSMNFQILLPRRNCLAILAPQHLGLARQLSRTEAASRPRPWPASAKNFRWNLEPLASVARQSWTGCGFVWAARTQVAHIELESGHERFERHRGRRQRRLRRHSLLDCGLSAAG